MSPGASDGQKISRRLPATIIAWGASPRFHGAVSRLILVCGLLVWLGVQGYLTLYPLWTAALPPELDDALTYVLKTKQMEECFFQDCPALEDLRRQLLVPSRDPQVERERFLAASKIFPVYHPLLSAILLAVSKLGLDLVTTYKLVWSLGPLIFGLAFAYLLTVLYGLPAAGLALGLLAFKVFPDTGLHHVVPSNLAMAVAVVVWARLLARRGEAPWTLIVGALALVGLHPIGRIYAVMAALLALWAAPVRGRPKVWLPVAGAALVVALAFLLSAVVQRPSLFNPALLPSGESPFLGMFLGAVQSLQQVVVEIIRSEGALFGAAPLFLGAVTLGWLTLPDEARILTLKMIGLYLTVLLGLLLYVSSHAADVILRLWIPLVVILFGLVGQALAEAGRRCWGLLSNYLQDPHSTHAGRLQQSWPLVLLAVLAGYALQMSVAGGEQVYVTADFVRQRQPLNFSPAQPELLLSQARPGDRVLYRSFIIMPYYFIHGAMRLGAVYYHPALLGDPTETEWLARPDLRFAVTYNPTVYHPSFAGVEEHKWWITSPDFHFSPLNNPRRHGPLAREGKIPTGGLKWLEIAPQDADFPKTLTIFIHNPGKASAMELVPGRQGGDWLWERKMISPIPAGWSGRLELDLKGTPEARRLRLQFPPGTPSYEIGGLVFGRDPLNWPWAQRAKVIAQPKGAEIGAFTLSFDPADLLPPPLNRKYIKVLDDEGSSVLLEIQ